MSIIKRLLEGAKFYGYACTKCKEEYITQVQQPKEKVCPKCGGKLRVAAVHRKA